MALYTILFGISIFMIALVLAIIKKVFFHWRQEHKSERMVRTAVNRPAVGAIITAERCIVRLRKYPRDILVYDVASRSELSLNENVPFGSQVTLVDCKPRFEPRRGRPSRRRLTYRQPRSACFFKRQSTLFPTQPVSL